MYPSHVLIECCTFMLLVHVFIIIFANLATTCILGLPKLLEEELGQLKKKKPLALFIVFHVMFMYLLIFPDKSRYLSPFMSRTFMGFEPFTYIFHQNKDMCNYFYFQLA